MSNLLWALASLEIDPGAELVGGMAARAAALLPEFRPPELSKLAWALDRMRVPPSLSRHYQHYLPITIGVAVTFYRGLSPYYHYLPITIWGGCYRGLSPDYH